MLENLVLGALFFVLVPGILVTLPRGGSKVTVALVHAVVFVLAYMLLQYFVAYAAYESGEGFTKSGATGGYNIIDIGGKMCQFPYDCTRGAGWFSGLSICKCKGGDVPSGSNSIIRNSSVDVRKLQYK
jgi:hypothetical protein